MAYEYLTNYNANAYMVGRMSNGVQYNVDKIIIHHWGAEGQTFDGVCAWFESPNCQTSAHYVVEGGRVACLVNLSDTAYHAGDWGANLTSIGIECRPEMSDADISGRCVSLWHICTRCLGSCLSMGTRILVLQHARASTIAS